MSETDWGDVAGEDAGEMGAGLWLAKKVVSDINNLFPSAWVLWQTIDYHKSEAGYMGNKDFGIPDTSKGYWGLAFADHDTEEIILTKKYFCLAQFTRYVNPGDTIIHSEDDILSAINHKTAEIKTVLINESKNTETRKIDVSEFKKDGTYEIIRTSGNIADGENIKHIGEYAFKNGIIEAELIPNSVTTVIIK